MSNPSGAPRTPGPAVLADVTEELRARLGDAISEIGDLHGTIVVRVAADDRPRALAVLKTLGFNYYSFCCGVDWPADNKMEVLDSVHSTKRNVRVTLKCEVPRDNPRLASGTSVYAGADWYERETWELFGIVFTGHPGLRRLFLPDWHEGYPMRKDEVLRARVEKPWPGEFFSG